MLVIVLYALILSWKSCCDTLAITVELKIMSIDFFFFLRRND